MHCIFVDMYKGTRMNTRVVLQIITPSDHECANVVHGVHLREHGKLKIGWTAKQFSPLILICVLFCIHYIFQPFWIDSNM
jgi:hypothetical protein